MSHFSVAVFVPPSRGLTIEQARHSADLMLAPFSEHLEVEPYPDDPEFRWNPDGHWDYYRLGGRYAAGLQSRSLDPADFHLDPCSWEYDRRSLGERSPGEGGGPPEASWPGNFGPNPCDIVRIKHIDFEAMGKARHDRAVHAWSEYEVELAAGADEHLARFRAGIGSDDTLDDFIRKYIGSGWTPWAIVTDDHGWEEREWGAEHDAEWSRTVSLRLGEQNPDGFVLQFDCHS